MVDKALTLKRLRVGSRIGQVETTKLLEVERCLAVFLGIAR
jgi:mRNA interferase MazF